MSDLRTLFADSKAFAKAISIYTRKRGHQGWVWFEAKKDIVVGVLVVRRGIYQRPFLHTSLMAFVGVGIVVAPMIASSYPTAAVDQLDQFIPPSAVLSSFDEQEVMTEKSERPRDSIITHIVEEGETISNIAQKFGISIDTIKWANPDLKGDSLVIGQKLNIPPVTGMVIKVKKGETIYSIAKKYQTEAQQILNYPFNDFADLDTFALVAGQDLVVPDGVMPEAKPVYSPKTIANVGLTPGDGQFIWPTSGRITQYPVSYHMAVDIANSSLPVITAADNGRVVLVEHAKYGYGFHVIIDHQNGYQTLYGHMSEIYVSVGQNVTKGMTIGKLGSTGRSSGPHLHFEVRQNGRLLNPLSFLK